MRIVGKWTVFYKWINLGMPIYKGMNLSFEDNGTFSGKDMGKAISGTWVEQGGMLIFHLTDSHCTYSEHWAGGKSVTGAIAAFDEEKQFGGFYMLHESHHAHITKRSEIDRSNIHRDVAGKEIVFKKMK